MSAADQVRADARKDPETLEREIDATREDMEYTLDALQEKLSPGQLLDQVLGLVREHGGEFARNLGGTVKQNPVPVMLTSIGLMWMMASQGRSPGSAPHGYVEWESETLDTDAEVTGDGSERRERLKQSAAAARDRVSGAAHRVSGAARGMSDRVGSAGQSARSQAYRAREGFSRMMDEQPLVVGALGVALGALIGASLPATRREDELLGRARDRALERAKETGKEAADTASRAVSEEMEARSHRNPSPGTGSDEEPVIAH